MERPLPSHKLKHVSVHNHQKISTTNEEGGLGGEAKKGSQVWANIGSTAGGGPDGEKKGTFESLSRGEGGESTVPQTVGKVLRFLGSGGAAEQRRREKYPRGTGAEKTSFGSR